MEATSYGYFLVMFWLIMKKAKSFRNYCNGFEITNQFSYFIFKDDHLDFVEFLRKCQLMIVVVVESISLMDYLFI